MLSNPDGVLAFTTFIGAILALMGGLAKLIAMTYWSRPIQTRRERLSEWAEVFAFWGIALTASASAIAILRTL